MTTKRTLNLDDMSEEQLKELKEQIDKRLHTDQLISANSSDIMTLFAHKYITERATIPVSDWVAYRHGSVIDFRTLTHRKTTSLNDKPRNAYTFLNLDVDYFMPGFFRCDSSIAPIDNYEKFKKLVTAVTFNEIETYDNGDSKPYRIFKCYRDNHIASKSLDYVCSLSDNEMIFGAGCSSRMVFETIDTAGRKPKRMMKSFDNDDRFLESFNTDRSDYFSGNNPLCLFIFATGEFEFYIIDESETAMYLIVKQNKIISFTEGVTGNNAVFHLYDDGKILAIGKDSCTVLIPTVEVNPVMTFR